jgi:hypothetical protein
MKQFWQSRKFRARAPIRPYNDAKMIAQHTELTRATLAMMLVKFLGGSLIATFLLMGAAAFNPNADKAFIKDLIPQAITPQVTLLGVALGYYFGAKDGTKPR